MIMQFEGTFQIEVDDNPDEDASEIAGEEEEARIKEIVENALADSDSTACVIWG